MILNFLGEGEKKENIKYSEVYKEAKPIYDARSQDNNYLCLGG